MLKSLQTKFGLSLLLALILAPAVQAETVRLANGEWAPYMSEKLKKDGVISDIVKEAFALEGYQVEYGFLPWKRGYEDAKTGKFNGSIIWSHSADREKDFDYSDSVIDLKTVFFIKKGGNFSWTDTASLHGKKIGGVIGYTYGMDDEEKAGTVKIDRISTPEANYKKLADGRLDAVPEDENVGWEIVNQLGLKDALSTDPKPLNTRSYHLILNKVQPENKKIMEAFNAGLKKLKESGKYDAMIAASRNGEYK